MVTTAAFVAEDSKAAEKSVLDSHMTYLQSNVFRYHDTFPAPARGPGVARAHPRRDRRTNPLPQAAGTIIGDVDHALEQCKRWEAAGADQLSFGLGMASKEESLEMVRLMGEHVIPKIDTDPVHRTTRMREAAAAKLPA